MRQPLLLFIEESGLNQFHFHGVQAFLAFFHFIFYFIVFTNFVDQPGGVNEDVLFVRVRGLNETKTFGVIEKFYCSLHFVMFY